MQALLAHRVAHALHEAGVPMVPHALANASRVLTGVEIHPAARIGDALFIDHGAGVVIGETAEIGDNVTLYQGVTLGGTGFARGKRHPTVEDDVVIGSGAKLLGPISVGEGVEGGRELGRDPRRAAALDRRRQPRPPGARRGKQPEGPDADWAHLPDPVADAIRAWRRGSASSRSIEAELPAAPEKGAEVRAAAPAAGGYRPGRGG